MSKYLKHEITDEYSAACIAEQLDAFLRDCDIAGVRPIVFVNESNGLQALPLLLERNINAKFCYIRSTHFERKQIDRAIDGLPDEFLEALATGEKVAVIDYGCRKDRSRAVYQGLPFIEYTLNCCWLDQEEEYFIYPRTMNPPRKQNATECFKRWYTGLPVESFEKLSRFRKQAQASFKEGGRVSITGISAPTTHDNEKDYYLRQKQLYLEALTQREAQEEN